MRRKRQPTRTSVEAETQAVRNYLAEADQGYRAGQALKVRSKPARVRWREHDRYVCASHLYLLDKGYSTASEPLDFPIPDKRLLLAWFDFAAIRSGEMLLVHVCVGDWPEGEDMEGLLALPCPPGVRKVIHRWHQGGRFPDERRL